MDTSVLVQQPDLLAIARARYPLAYCFALDRDYNIPTDEAVAKFNQELAHLLFQLYGDKWQEFFDCDNFTFEALALAYRKHFIARIAGTGNAQGVALGLICFLVKPTDLNTGHCIGTRLCPDLQLREFEPQNRLPYRLTPAQCQSVSLCIFC